MDVTFVFNLELTSTPAICHSSFLESLSRRYLCRLPGLGLQKFSADDFELCDHHWLLQTALGRFRHRRGQVTLLLVLS